MLRMRRKQFQPRMRDGMNPDIVANIVPLSSQTTEIECRYWRDVCRVSARQQTARKTLERPTPPKSLQRAFVSYANAEGQT